MKGPALKNGTLKTGSLKPEGRTKRKSRRNWGRWFLILVSLLLGLVALVAVGFVVLVDRYGKDLPDVRVLREYHEPQLTRVLDRNGEVLAELFEERRSVVPLSRVPRGLILSVLAAEDADFYRHRGLDYAGLFRAIVRGAMQGGRFRGTSTITQQLVKNLLLSSERSFERKFRELILSRRLEQTFLQENQNDEVRAKNEILELYLNHINFGHGRYGVQEASRYYFDKDVSDLSLAEASLLAGVPQSPTHLSPRNHPEAARNRQLFVLAQLEQKRAEYWPDLPAADIQRARDTVVRISDAPEASRLAPEIVEIARRELEQLVGREAAQRGGFVIHTTLDSNLQRIAREETQKGLRALDQRNGYRGPLRRPTERNRGPRTSPRIDRLVVGQTYDAEIYGRSDEDGTIELRIGGHAALASISSLARFNPDNLLPSRFAQVGARTRAQVISVPDATDSVGSGGGSGAGSGAGEKARVQLELGPEAAVVIIDPRSRDVLALIGGYEARAGFNRATQALRQPGSSFKPMVYAVALRSRRFTLASRVLDAPGVYDQWQPRNYETWNFQGEMSLRDALAQSVNQVAVRVMEDVTPPAVVDFSRSLGISSTLEPSLALALGASEVRPIELGNAYATFASGGEYLPHRIIRRIERADGTVVQMPPRPAPVAAMTSAESFLMNSLLSSVVQRGTATAAKVLNRAVAGKTGTSNDARDAWFVGYSVDLVAAVWVGFDDHRPLGRRESGARSALPIWVSTMQRALQGRPRLDFPVPAGVSSVSIDAETGLLAADGQTNSVVEYFLSGTEPTSQARPQDSVDSNELLLQQMQ